MNNSHLEQLFDLQPEETHVAETKPLSLSTYVDAIEAIDKIEAALPQVRGLESSEQELDELAEAAMKGYKDITDLGFNVDMKYSAEILGVASNMLGHALDAKTNKIKKKLKVIELQLKKQKLEQDKLKDSNATGIPPNTISGEAVSMDRNSLLQKILQDHKDGPKA